MGNTLPSKWAIEVIFLPITHAYFDIYKTLKDVKFHIAVIVGNSFSGSC